MTENNKRSHKRVITPRMAMIASRGKSHASYIEDISPGGAMLHIADLDENMFAPGEKVDVIIDEMTPLRAEIVRIDAPLIAINFICLDQDGQDRVAAEIMDHQEKFGLDDPEGGSS